MKRSLFLLSSVIALSFVLTRRVVVVSAAKTSNSEATANGGKCPRWNLPVMNHLDGLDNCSQPLFDQLRRTYGHDAHIFCNEKISLPIYELENSVVGLVMVIYGEQNRELTIWNHVEDFFFTHILLLYTSNCSYPHRFQPTPDKQGSQLLKESWWRTVEDLDCLLSKENFTRNPEFICIGDILLIIDDQVFVKSFGCYKPVKELEFSSPKSPKFTYNRPMKQVLFRKAGFIDASFHTTDPECKCNGDYLLIMDHVSVKSFGCFKEFRFSLRPFRKLPSKMRPGSIDFRKLFDMISNKGFTATNLASNVSSI